MMNLCFVTPALDPAEGGPSLTHLCEGLAARGHRVSLISPGDSRLDRSDSGVVHFRVSALRERLERGLFRASLELNRLLRGIDPDVIDCRSFGVLPPVSMACRMGRIRTRVCVSVRELEPTHRARLIGPGRLALAQDASTTCAMLRRRLVDGGMARHLGEVIYPGIDPEWLRPEEEVEGRGLPGGHGVVRLGTLGRLVDLPGNRVLLEALVRLNDSPVRFQLDVAGEGSQQDRLETYARKLGLAGRVRFHGRHPDPRSLLDRIDMLVIPSLQEAFPVLILEAMARGAPILCVARGGVPEVVNEGRTGFLYPPGQVDALVRALQRCAGEPERVREARKNARELVEQRFLTDHMVSAYERWFERVWRGRD